MHLLLIFFFMMHTINNIWNHHFSTSGRFQSYLSFYHKVAYWLQLIETLWFSKLAAAAIEIKSVLHNWRSLRFCKIYAVRFFISFITKSSNFFVNFSRNGPCFSQYDSSSYYYYHYKTNLRVVWIAFMV